VLLALTARGASPGQRAGGRTASAAAALEVYVARARASSASQSNVRASPTSDSSLLNDVFEAVRLRAARAAPPSRALGRKALLTPALRTDPDPLRFVAKKAPPAQEYLKDLGSGEL
jgi:hypothetical protein